VRASVKQISHLPQVNFAEAVVNHAWHRPARGGDVENRLPPVGSPLAFHDAALEHHAEVLAEIYHRAAGRVRALGDAHLAAIGQHLDNRPTELATQGEHRGHRIKLRQTVNGIDGQIIRCFWTGIAHFPAICRNSPRRQANCAKKLFRNTRRMTRSAKKKFRTTQRTSRSAKKRFRIVPVIGSSAKRKFRNREKGVYLPIVLYLCTSKNKVPQLLQNYFSNIGVIRKPINDILLGAGKGVSFPKK